MEGNRSSRGSSRGGHRGPGRGRGARGAAASISAVGSDTGAPPGSAKWKASQSGDPSRSDRPASGRGERLYGGSTRNTDDPSVEQSSRDVDASATPPRASWYQRGSRARGRYPRSAWGGPVGRSDDQHWRQHDDGRSAEAPVGATPAAVQAAQDPRLSGTEPNLSVAAPEFVPNEGFSLFGPYSFIALGPTGQPVTMMLQPAPGQHGFGAKQEGLTTDQKAVIAAMAVVAPPKPVAVPIANVLPTPVPPTVKTEEPLRKVDEAQPPLWKDRRPVTGLKQSGSLGLKTDQQPDNRKVTTETVETKIISPRGESNPGCSRLTHRGSINFQGEKEVVRVGTSKHASGNVATNSNGVSEAPATNQASKTRGTVRNSSDNKKNEKAASKIHFSSSGAPFSANAVAATKRILSRAEKRNPAGFASNDKDFPALDSKLKELKLEAEARESAPITWRRSGPDHGDSDKSNRTTDGKPKFSYAARLRNPRVAEPQPISAPPSRDIKGAAAAKVSDKTTAAKGSNDDWWEPNKKPAENETPRNPVIEKSSIGVIDEVPSADEADPSATVKPKRRRRRRRKKVADSSSRDKDDDDDEHDGDARDDGEKSQVRGEGPSALNGSEIADCDGAAKIEDGKTTTTTTTTSGKAEVNRVSTNEVVEDIFKDDDFPDFLVDFRRGLASAAAAATRKIPRVIGSKVTKLGAGKPLSKAVNEWTDVTSDDVKDERKSRVEISVPTSTTSAWPSAWGNAAVRSFAETLKMAARPTAAPMPTKIEAVKPTEDGETAKKKKRKVLRCVRGAVSVVVIGMIDTMGTIV